MPIVGLVQWRLIGLGSAHSLQALDCLRQIVRQDRDDERHALRLLDADVAALLELLQKLRKFPAEPSTPTH